MKKASIGELRYNFARIESLLRQGEDIQITKYGRVIGRLAPENETVPKRPDFLVRLRSIYGDTQLKVSGAELIETERR